MIAKSSLDSFLFFSFALINSSYAVETSKFQLPKDSNTELFFESKKGALKSAVEGSSEGAAIYFLIQNNPKIMQEVTRPTPKTMYFLLLDIKGIKTIFF